MKIAKTEAKNPKVSLEEKPTGNLESKTGRIVLEFLKKLHKNGKTIVMVTHDRYIANAAQRIEHLKDGIISR